jgi:hypothetical protein
MLFLIHELDVVLTLWALLSFAATELVVWHFIMEHDLLVAKFTGLWPFFTH